MREAPVFFRFVVRRPIATLMALGGLTLLGVVAYLQLPVQLLPDFDLPKARIYAGASNLSVEEMEERVTLPIEAMLAATPRVKEIISYVRPQYTRVQVSFDFGTDMRFAQLDLQEKMGRLAKTLREERFSYDVAMESSSEWEASFLWCVLGGPGDEATLSRYAEERVAPIVSAVDGVASVDVGGGQRRTIDVIFQPDLLDAYGLSVQRAASRLGASVAENYSVGSLQGSAETCQVVLRNRLESLEDLRQTLLDDQGVVRLGDVAQVVDNRREPDYLFRFNGKNVVGFSVRKEAQANPIQLSRQVLAAIARAKAALPPGFDIEVIFNVAEFVEKILTQIARAAVLGALLAMAVLFLFLRSVRMSLIVFAAIPISIIGTFVLMYFWGVTINILTLLGLAFAVGLLVDASIVVIENIFRHYERSGDAAAAAEGGAAQVWRALTATTATNLVVFVPILFAQGEIRLIFTEGALAVIFPLVISLGMALTFVPMLTARMLLLKRPESGGAGRTAGWRVRLRDAIRKRNVYWPAWRRRPRRLHREFYGVLLRSALRHRFRLLVVIVLAILATYHICMPMIRSDVIETDPQQASFPVYLQAPAGSSARDLERAVSLAEKGIARIPEVKNYRVFGNVERGAAITVELKKANERKRTLEQVQDTVLEEIGPIPGAIASLVSPDREARRPMEMRRGGGLEIQGSDDAQIKNVAVALATQLETFPEVARAELESDTSAAEYQFRLDPERAALFQVSPPDVARLIQSTQHEGLFTQLYLEEGDQRTAIFLRSTEQTRENASIEEVKQLRVLTRRGEAAPLKDIGHFQTAGGERRILRKNFQRIVNVDFYLTPGAAGKRDPRKAIEEWVKTLRVPAGVTVQMSGQNKKAEEGNAQTLWMMGMTVVLVYMTMASIFESLLAPLVIMITVPLAGLGVFWALALSGTPNDEMAKFGMIMLIGIVVNSGIILLDFVGVLRHEHGYRRARAVLESCYARLRPILMTTLTTILGLLPMALKQSEDFHWASLAIVVTSGLASSTLLTLLVVPAMLMNAEDAVAFTRRAGMWSAQRIGRPLFRRLSRAGRRLAALGAGPSRRLLRRAVRPAADRPAEAEWGGTAAASGPAHGAWLAGTADSEGPPSPNGPLVIARRVYMTYPVFRPRKMTRVVPSPRYKIGRRPPQGIDALQGIDFAIGRGMCGLLGPNGAGKTTLMQILAGLLVPTRGYVEICGMNLAAQRERGRRRIGYLPQRFGVPEEFTARQFLDFHGLTMGLRDAAARRARIEQVLEAVNLTAVAKQRVGGYSGGMKQRLGIARVLLKLPPFLMVDEPTAGLDPIERVKFRNLLSRLSEERVVLFSTHIIEDISASCGRLAVIHEGRIVYQGSPSGLAERLRGQVWEYAGLTGESADLANTAHVLRQRPDGVGAQYRLICPFRPRPSAQSVEPTIEDAYMGVILEAARDNGRGTRTPIAT